MYIYIYVLFISFFIFTYIYCVNRLLWPCEPCIYIHPFQRSRCAWASAPHYTSHKYQLTPLQRAGPGINPSSRGVSLHHSGAIISRCTLGGESCTPGQALA